MKSRFTVTMNDDLGFMGGMYPVPLDYLDKFSNIGKEVMVSRGLETDLKTVEEFIVELTVYTNSQDQLTSHLHETTGRLNGGIQGPDGMIHYPFNFVSKNPLTGKYKELTSEKMDDIYRDSLLYPVVCYYWKLKEDDSTDPTQNKIYGGNKGEVDHMIKIETCDDPEIDKVIFGNTKYRSKISGSVVPFVMKTVSYNDRTKCRLSF